ncbi:sensory histidine kinase AtoS [compost metagenome]
MKYRSPERKLSVTVRTYISNEQEIMEFIDNGLGINLEQNNRNLFGLHKTFHKHKDAKGVGLFLTRKHIEAMGGKIFAESNPIYGIKFTLIFNYHENH